MLRPARPLLVLLLPLAVAALGAKCGGGPPSIRITSPVSGSFTNASSVAVSGVISNVGARLAGVTVNGVPVTVTNNAFSAQVNLDPNAIFNPIVAELILTSGNPRRDRVTVVAGDGVNTGYVLDGDFSPDGVALRLSDPGLNDIEAVVTDLVDFDPATLLTPGQQVISNYCAIDSIFGCLGRVDVYIANPPASITGFGIDIDSMTGFAAGDVNISGLRVDLDIDGSGLAPSCGLRITAANTAILGDYDLAPMSVDPTLVDVNQVGSLTVGFSGFNSSFTSGICDFPLIGDLIQLIIGDVQPLVLSGLQGFLNDPDGSGPLDGPIADAIEDALAGVEIAGPIGAGIGVNLEAPLVDIAEDDAGLTLRSDAAVTASMPDPNAPDLPASYTVGGSFPVFGATSPGGFPYGVAISISDAAFNQLLKAEIESGLLQETLTAFDFGTGTVPLTAGLLSLFVPEFAILDPDQPLVIELEPTIAPVLTGASGPQGEMVELRLAHLTARVKDPTGLTTTRPFLVLAVDAQLGLDVAFANGVLGFSVGNLMPSQVQTTILVNEIGTNEVSLQGLLPQLLAFALPQLGDSLGAFPIPGFLGLELSPVEVVNQSGYLSIFADFTPVP